MTAGPHTLQILTTEHWSLLAARSLVYTEAMSRTSIFVAALSGAVVALALVAQGTDFGSAFVAFSLVLLPVVYFLGWATIVRLSQVNLENARWVQGMNRIRNAYLQLAPELEPYFVTSQVRRRRRSPRDHRRARWPDAPVPAIRLCARGRRRHQLGRRGCRGRSRCDGARSRHRLRRSSPVASSSSRQSSSSSSGPGVGSAGSLSRAPYARHLFRATPGARAARRQRLTRQISVRSRGDAERRHDYGDAR